MPTRQFPPAVFQSFAETSDATQVAPRLKALRAVMAEQGFGGLLVPRADAHRGESVPDSEARLAWLTGFTGSAGLALIGAERAALFVDSRYTLQAPTQTDTALIDVLPAERDGINPQAREYVPQGSRIAFDPWLHTPGEVRALSAFLEGVATLVPAANLIDAVWTDRPAPPQPPVELLGHNRAGRAAEDKIAEIQAALATDKADAAVLTLPESICWLFNIRGRDVPNTPFVLAFAIVPQAGKPTVYLDPAKVTPELQQALGNIATLAPKADFAGALAAWGEKAVLIDPATAPAAVESALREAGARLVEKRDPVLLPKSRKNAAELSGMREAHRLDAVALAKFLHWFDGTAPGGVLTETGIVTALEAFRREDESCVDASFETISGAGPNGAIVHYRVTDKTDRQLAAGELMLLDSGAQYLAGTTDITRTLFTGSATPEQRDRFTRVLKGMIAISKARFPRGTTGGQLDVLARQFLWADGVTYHHGTGHGVGAYLGVHEGPVGLSPRYTVPFEPGNVISNEPGYYKAGEYGIRIENLITVIESPQFEGFLEFETLTLVPVDTRLVQVGMLDAEERDWLNRYHARVWSEIGPLVDDEVKAWLRGATAPL